MADVGTDHGIGQKGVRVLLVEDDQDIRSLQPTAWIVACTANRAAAETAGVLDAGADLVVEKMAVGIQDLVILALAGRAGQDP
jgi:hypothetical protein